MANKKTTPKSAPRAPKIEPEVAKTVEFTPTDYQNTMGSLDSNHVVDLLKIQHETFRMDPNAAKRYNMSAEAVETINRVNAIAQAAVICQEIALGNTQFALTMRTAEGTAIAAIAKELNIKIDQTKMLPVDEEHVALPAEAITIPKETKTRLQKEVELRNKLIPKDANRVQTDEELLEAVKFVGAGDAGVTDYLTSYLSNKSPFKGILNATKFYRQYLISKASNEEDREKAAKLSIPELMYKISNIMPDCTFILNGISKFFITEIERSESPIVPFAAFRNSADGLVDDQTVADMVKSLVIWAGNAHIKANTKQIKELSKDKEKNQAEIDALKKENEKYSKVIVVVTNPEGTIAENLISDYESHDKNATTTFQMIANTYYSKDGLVNVKIDSLKKNVEQRAGIILNLFRDPLSQMINYSESNLTDLEYLTEEEIKAASKPTEKPEEKPTEEETPKKD